ncbi:hypothetical protein EGR_00148 [Echinococcus granulosus]|uniref:Uncharacterized protein n=1 Tax=Echinococcus granulosus TaxID=6210 RepID=W6VD53_ECHGR|nr:hypothetical protein EGR_00148 [Echinococcus granulosus]EUB64879.1 hypothetical protein EGR_00148 [Echinococcus granulosus]
MSLNVTRVNQNGNGNIVQIHLQKGGELKEKVEHSDLVLFKMMNLVFINVGCARLCISNEEERKNEKEVTHLTDGQSSILVQKASVGNITYHLHSNVHLRKSIKYYKGYFLTIVWPSTITRPIE